VAHPRVKIAAAPLAYRAPGGRASTLDFPCMAHPYLQVKTPLQRLLAAAAPLTLGAPVLGRAPDAQ